MHGDWGEVFYAEGYGEVVIDLAAFDLATFDRDQSLSDRSRMGGMVLKKVCTGFTCTKMGVLLSYANLYRLMLSHTYLHLSLYLRGGTCCLRKIEISMQLLLSQRLSLLSLWTLLTVVLAMLARLV
jgi:hypothetical protein